MVPFRFDLRLFEVVEVGIKHGAVFNHAVGNRNCDEPTGHIICANFRAVSLFYMDAERVSIAEHAVDAKPK